ncbi:DUF3016 domain-containing protein [Pleionea sediminis]|uniref:DUF3016 domain-containing protein n=1 Tax=Pleionea sediminis TaxID=2569479 RepID=UPI0011850DD5|nr:DUF3016 domain-containing protein [Pleionea sediminis]
MKLNRKTTRQIQSRQLYRKGWSIKGLALVSMLAMSSWSLAEIKTDYLDPIKFDDIQSTERSRKQSVTLIQEELDGYLHDKGEQYLKSGHQLSIQFTDVDRAGRIEYSSTGRGYRVLRDLVRVRIEFNYVLKDESGKVIREGKESLKKNERVNSIESRSRSRDTLYYETALLEKWLSDLYQ